MEGFWRLYTDDFYDIRLPVPPIAERQAIIEHNDRVTAGMNRAIAVAQNEIALLREYRTRLIADAVTGKIDVREAAARLPQELPETEPPDETANLLQDEETAEDLEVEAEEAA